MIKEINRFEQQYKNLLAVTLRGSYKENRNGNSYYSFGEDLKINLKRGFPIVTGKKIFFDKAYHEYKWMMDGLRTTTYLKENDIHWWDEFADKNGDLGKTYGYQLRSFNGEVDQLEWLHWKLKTDPNCRRIHITLWNPSELNETKLPPCYTGFTFSHCNGVLNMNMHFRSSDLFLGLPYDICVGALFLTEVANFHDMEPGILKLDITDGHIYENHLEQVERYIKTETYKLPTYSYLDKSLIDYNCGPLIKAKLNI